MAEPTKKPFTSGVKGFSGGKLQHIGGEGEFCRLLFRMPASDQGGGSWVYNFVSLPDVSESKSADYQTQTIWGRASPIQSYTGSGARTFSVSWKVYNIDAEAKDENMKLIRSIAASVHPNYSEGAYKPPPLVLFQCGLLTSGLKEGGPSITCLLSSYNFEYSSDQIRVKDLLPLVIPIQLELEVVYSQDTLPGTKDVFEGKY